jgi:hypothetical protein
METETNGKEAGMICEDGTSMKTKSAIFHTIPNTTIM